MIITCPYCQVSTAGEHEHNCPCNSMITTPNKINNIQVVLLNTCENCKWWSPDNACMNSGVNNLLKHSGNAKVTVWFEPFAEFGCLPYWKSKEQK